MHSVDIGRLRPCTSCFACAGICPKNAIYLEPDENGFYKPTINQNLCINCGICQNVCYSHIESSPGEITLKAYYGWHKDATVLRKSASGGITVALCQNLIDKGYWIVGCAYDHSIKKAKHIFVKETKDIELIIGSKYFQSDLSDAIKLLKNMPENQPFAFFGLPCQILGIKKMLPYIGISANLVLFVELFCHGVVSPKVWQCYLRENSKAKNAENIKFRTKYYGWHIPTNEFVINKKSIPTIRTGDLFFEAFYSTEFFNQSCYQCEARKNIGNADVRIGDYWGKRFHDNKLGVSCIISTSDKGNAALYGSRKYFELYEGDLEDILSGQSYDKIHPYNENNWHENYERLSKVGLKKCMSRINRRKPILIRLKKRTFNIASNLKHKMFK